ncbi:MAG: hypothetical protein P4L87_24395 [Formivibrio sp.]|nr:hypothetical protein [Formivibrio sp.]
MLFAQMTTSQHHQPKPDRTRNPEMSASLFLGVVGAIGFNFAPILLGYGMAMNACFMVYAAIILLLSFADPRVLGYATVLSACNPANSLANLSFSFLLAVLTIIKEFHSAGRVIRELSSRIWWWLLLATFLLILLSVPAWSADTRNIITEAKDAMSRLGYLVVFPVAIALTIRSRQDAVRSVSLLCFMSIGTLAAFYFIGQAGVEVITAAEGGESIGVEQHIGNIHMNFVRTQVCIPIAALATSSLALGIGLGLNRWTLPYYLASGIAVFMIMALASTGSAFAMVCSFAIIAVGYIRMTQSKTRAAFAVLFFMMVALALYFIVFQTSNALSARIEQKLQANEIDRMKYWQEAIQYALATPIGEGWIRQSVLAHNDFLLFFIAYGWPTGLFYAAASGALFLSLRRELQQPSGLQDAQSGTLLLVAQAALSVYVVNSFLDMLSANIGYYQIVWALILTPATVIAVSGDFAKIAMRTMDAKSTQHKQFC